MPTQRQVRLGELLREEVSRIIREEVKDPRLGFVSLTEVEVAPDLRQATIFVSVMGTPEEQRGNLAALESAAGFIRHRVGRDLRLRHIPELTFRLDRSLERGARIFELLAQVKREEGGSGRE